MSRAMQHRELGVDLLMRLLSQNVTPCNCVAALPLVRKCDNAGAPLIRIILNGTAMAGLMTGTSRRCSVQLW